MSDTAPVQLRISVRPSAETNDHEVVLFGGDQNLIEYFGDKSLGLDPDDILLAPCALLSAGTQDCLIGRCECGCIGCDDVHVRVSMEDDTVLWAAVHGSRAPVRFELSAYTAEIQRAMSDHSWETPERTVARLVRTEVDRERLRGFGLKFSWASGRTEKRTLTVSLSLEPGPYQVLVHMPFNDLLDPRITADAVTALLARDPSSWPDVEWNPQSDGLDAPAIAGAGWRRWKF